MDAMRTPAKMLQNLRNVMRRDNPRVSGDLECFVTGVAVILCEVLIYLEENPPRNKPEKMSEMP